MRLTVEATAGERVAFYRRRKGITQEMLAGLLGLCCRDQVRDALLQRVGTCARGT